MARGYLDTSYIDLPDNIDLTYLRGLQLPSGLAFTDLVRVVDEALTGVNAGVDPLTAMLMAPRTTEVTAEGGDDSTMTIERRGQYALPRPQLVAGAAHMLAIGGVHIGIGFTESALKRMTLSAIRRNTNAMARALARGFNADLFYRLFSTAEITVDPENRTTATSPGFAGSGSGGNVFSSVYPDGSATAGSYTLYYQDTTANRAAILLTVMTEMLKWHEGPLDILGSSTSIAALEALPLFVSAGSVLVRTAQGSAEALVDVSRYLGVYNGQVRVWKARNEWTSDHYAMFKSYGDFNSLNPLVMRYDPVDGPDAYVESRAAFPLANAVALWTYGINVNNRVGAALIRIAASGGYVAPTIVG
jgi:hypothetical protein